MTNNIKEIYSILNAECDAILEKIKTRKEKQKNVDRNQRTN
jgi:hypothetical protein